MQIVFNQKSDETVLINANTANAKVNSLIFESFSQSTRFGVLFRSKRCNMCKKYLERNDEEDENLMAVEEDLFANLDDDLSDEDGDPLTGDDGIKVFACHHAYHLRCVRKHYRKKVSAQEFEELFTTVRGA